METHMECCHVEMALVVCILFHTESHVAHVLFYTESHVAHVLFHTESHVECVPFYVESHLECLVVSGECALAPGCYGCCLELNR